MRLAAVIFLALLLLPAVAIAGPLEDARYAYYDLGDDQAALKLVQPLADQGNGEAQELLAEMYFHGAGVKRDEKMGGQWYTAAVASYRKAAERGDANAQVRLGSLYERWNIGGLKHDYNEAMKWFRKAADQGNAEAELEIGTLYSWGWGVKQDSAETLKWWHAAAEHGNADAQMQLGQLYNRRQNFEEALKWWRKGAEQNDGYSLINLASMYSDGHGVEKDDTEALKLIRRAANNGFGNAQNELGDRYDRGDGVKRDYAEAYFWHSLRGATFNSPGRAEMSAKHLTPEQRTAIDIRVKDWKPTRVQPPAPAEATGKPETR